MNRKIKLIISVVLAFIFSIFIYSSFNKTEVNAAVTTASVSEYGENESINNYTISTADEFTAFLGLTTKDTDIFTITSSINVTTPVAPMPTFKGILNGNNYTVNIKVGQDSGSNEYCVIKENKGTIKSLSLTLTGEKSSTEKDSSGDQGSISFVYKNSGLINSITVQNSNFYSTSTNNFSEAAVVILNYGIINKVTVSGSTFVGFGNGAGIAAYSFEGAKIIACKVQNSTIHGLKYAGGICGKNDGLISSNAVINSAVVIDFADASSIDYLNINSSDYVYEDQSSEKSDYNYPEYSAYTKYNANYIGGIVGDSSGEVINNQLLCNKIPGDGTLKGNVYVDIGKYYAGLLAGIASNKIEGNIVYGTLYTKETDNGTDPYANPQSAATNYVATFSNNNNATLDNYYYSCTAYINESSTTFTDSKAVEATYSDGAFSSGTDQINDLLSAKYSGPSDSNYVSINPVIGESSITVTFGQANNSFEVIFGFPTAEKYQSLYESITDISDKLFIVSKSSTDPFSGSYYYLSTKVTAGAYNGENELTYANGEYYTASAEAFDTSDSFNIWFYDPLYHDYRMIPHSGYTNDDSTLKISNLFDNKVRLGSALFVVQDGTEFLSGTLFNYPNSQMMNITDGHYLSPTGSDPYYDYHTNSNYYKISTDIDGEDTRYYDYSFSSSKAFVVLTVTATSKAVIYSFDGGAYFEDIWKNYSTDPTFTPDYELGDLFGDEDQYMVGGIEYTDANGNVIAKPTTIESVIKCRVIFGDVFTVSTDSLAYNYGGASVSISTSKISEYILTDGPSVEFIASNSYGKVDGSTYQFTNAQFLWVKLTSGEYVCLGMADEENKSISSFPNGHIKITVIMSDGSNTSSKVFYIPKEFGEEPEEGEAEYWQLYTPYWNINDENPIINKTATITSSIEGHTPTTVGKNVISNYSQDETITVLFDAASTNKYSVFYYMSKEKLDYAYEYEYGGSLMEEGEGRCDYVESTTFQASTLTEFTQYTTKGGVIKWFDQDGNEINIGDELTKDIAVYPVFLKTISFTVNPIVGADGSSIPFTSINFGLSDSSSTFNQYTNDTSKKNTSGYHYDEYYSYSFNTSTGIVTFTYSVSGVESKAHLYIDYPGTEEGSSEFKFFDSIGYDYDWIDSTSKKATLKFDLLEVVFTGLDSHPEVTIDNNRWYPRIISTEKNGEGNAYIQKYKGTNDVAYINISDGGTDYKVSTSNESLVSDGILQIAVGGGSGQLAVDLKKLSAGVQIPLTFTLTLTVKYYNADNMSDTIKTMTYGFDSGVDVMEALELSISKFITLGSDKYFIGSFESTLTEGFIMPESAATLTITVYSANQYSASFNYQGHVDTLKYGHTSEYSSDYNIYASFNGDSYSSMSPNEEDHLWFYIDGGMLYVASNKYGDDLIGYLYFAPSTATSESDYILVYKISDVLDAESANMYVSTVSYQQYNGTSVTLSSFNGNPYVSVINNIIYYTNNKDIVLEVNFTTDQPGYRPALVDSEGNLDTGTTFTLVRNEENYDLLSFNTTGYVGTTLRIGKVGEDYVFTYRFEGSDGSAIEIDYDGNVISSKELITQYNNKIEALFKQNSVVTGSGKTYIIRNLDYSYNLFNGFMPAEDVTCTITLCEAEASYTFEVKYDGEDYTSFKTDDFCMSESNVTPDGDTQVVVGYNDGEDTVYMYFNDFESYLWACVDGIWVLVNDTVFSSSRESGSLTTLYLASLTFNLGDQNITDMTSVSDEYIYGNYSDGTTHGKEISHTEESTKVIDSFKFIYNSVGENSFNFNATCTTGKGLHLTTTSECTVECPDGRTEIHYTKGESGEAAVFTLTTVNYKYLVTSTFVSSTNVEFSEDANETYYEYGADFSVGYSVGDYVVVISGGKNYIALITAITYNAEEACPSSVVEDIEVSYSCTVVRSVSYVFEEIGGVIFDPYYDEEEAAWILKSGDSKHVAFYNSSDEAGNLNMVTATYYNSTSTVKAFVVEDVGSIVIYDSNTETKYRIAEFTNDYNMLSKGTILFYEVNLAVEPVDGIEFTVYGNGYYPSSSNVKIKIAHDSAYLDAVIPDGYEWRTSVEENYILIDMPTVTESVTATVSTAVAKYSITYKLFTEDEETIIKQEVLEFEYNATINGYDTSSIIDVDGTEYIVIAAYKEGGNPAPRTMPSESITVYLHSDEATKVEFTGSFSGYTPIWNGNNLSLHATKSIYLCASESESMIDYSTYGQSRRDTVAYKDGYIYYSSSMSYLFIYSYSTSCEVVFDENETYYLIDWAGVPSGTTFTDYPYYFPSSNNSTSFSITIEDDGYTLTTATANASIALSEGTTYTVTYGAYLTENITIEYAATAKEFKIYYYKNQDDFNTYGKVEEIDEFYLYDVATVKYGQAIPTSTKIGTITNQKVLTKFYNSADNSEFTLTTMPKNNIILYGVWDDYGRVQVVVSFFDLDDVRNYNFDVKLSASAESFTDYADSGDAAYKAEENKDGSENLTGVTFDYLYGTDVYVWVKKPGESTYSYFGAVNSEPTVEYSYYKYELIVNGENEDDGPYLVTSGNGYYPLEEEHAFSITAPSLGKRVAMTEFTNVPYTVDCDTSGLVITVTYSGILSSNIKATSITTTAMDRSYQITYKLINQSGTVLNTVNHNGEYSYNYEIEYNYSINQITTIGMINYIIGRMVLAEDAAIPSTMPDSNLEVLVYMYQANRIVYSILADNEDTPTIEDSKIYISSKKLGEIVPSSSSSELNKEFTEANGMKALMTFNEGYLYYSSNVQALYLVSGDVPVLLWSLSNSLSEDTWYYVSVTGLPEGATVSNWKGYYRATDNVNIMINNVADGYGLTSTDTAASFTENSGIWTLGYSTLDSNVAIPVTATPKEYTIYYYKNEDAYNDKTEYYDTVKVHYLDEIPTSSKIGTHDANLKLVGWLDGDGNSFNLTTMPAKDLTLYGSWEPIGVFNAELSFISDSTETDYDVRLSTSATEQLFLSSSDADYTISVAEGTGYTSFTYDPANTNIYLWVRMPGTEEYKYVMTVKDTSNSVLVESTNDTYYKVVVNASDLENTTVSGMGWYKAGTEEITISFTSEPGYKVNMVTENYDIFNSTITIHNLNGYVSLAVEEEHIVYHIYYKVDNKLWQTVNKYYGEEVVLAEYPSGDYEFEGWTGWDDAWVNEETGKKLMPSIDVTLKGKLSVIKKITVEGVLPEGLSYSNLFVSSSATTIEDKREATLVDGKIVFRFVNNGYIWIHDPISNEDRYLGVEATSELESITLVKITLATGATSNLSVSNLGYVLKDSAQTLEVKPERGYGFNVIGTDFVRSGNTLSISSVSSDIELKLEEYKIKYTITYKYVEIETINGVDVETEKEYQKDTYEYGDEVIVPTINMTLNGYLYNEWSQTIDRMPDADVIIYAQRTVIYTLTKSPTLSRVHAGQKLSDIEVQPGIVKVGGVEKTGTYTFKNSDTVLKLSDSMLTEFVLLFSFDNYIQPLEITVTVEVCNPKYVAESFDTLATNIKISNTSISFNLSNKYEYAVAEDQSNTDSSSLVYKTAGEVTVNSLKAETSYVIYYRYKADDNYCESDIVSYTFDTLTNDNVKYNDAVDEGKSVLQDLFNQFDSDAVKQQISSIIADLSTPYNSSDAMTGEEIAQFVEYVSEAVEVLFDIELSRKNVVNLNTDRIQKYAEEKEKEITEWVFESYGDPNTRVGIREVTEYKQFVLNVYSQCDKMLSKFNVGKLFNLNNEKTSLSSLVKSPTDVDVNSALDVSDYVVDKVDELLDFDHTDYKDVSLTEYSDVFVQKTVTLMSDLSSTAFICNGETYSLAVCDKIANLKAMTYKDYKFDRAAYDAAFYLAAEAAIIAYLQNVVLTELKTQYDAIVATYTDSKKIALLEVVYNDLYAKYSDFDTFKELYFEAIGDSGDVTYDDVVEIFKKQIADSLVIPVNASLTNGEIIALVGFVSAIVSGCLAVAIISIIRRRRAHYAR